MWLNIRQPFVVLILGLLIPKPLKGFASLTKYVGATAPCCFLTESCRLTNHRRIQFHASNPDAVVLEMEAMAKLADGTTWLNVTPALDDPQAAIMADRSGAAGWFTGRGSDLPLATWVPADLSGRKPEPPSLGIQHGTGSNALERLADVGLVLPEVWVKQQDSGKRGIVLAIPTRVPHSDIIDFTTAALIHLVPRVDFGKRFDADVVQA